MRKNAYFAAIGTVILVTLFLGFNYLSKKVTQPSFCTNCHEIENEYMVWTVSSHSQVNCMKCHGEQGFKGLVKQNLKALTHVYLHLAQVEGKGTGFEAEIPDTRCQTCHSSKREVTPGGDLIIPHKKHIDNPEVRCVDCHRNVIHGGENGTRIVAELANQPREEVKTELRNRLQRKDFLPSMGLCLECHDGKQAPYSCQTCHQEIATPESHQEQGWKSGGHGTVARQELTVCIECHVLVAGNGNSKKNVEELSLYQVVDNNQFCKKCHANRPPSHVENWEFIHRLAAANDSEGCLACHLKENSEQQAEIAISCDTCHENNHGDNWLRKHPSVVREYGTPECYSCHGPNNCANCHTTRAAQLLQRLD